MLLALLGLALAGSAAFSDGAALGRWSLRGPILIFGALVAFGLSIRPLGLLVAGPLAVLISAGASNETRLFETILFGALITAFCIGLFKFALGLPIPLAPWLIGY
jgi:putative tricarboxylic transport membrane protein